MTLSTFSNPEKRQALIKKIILWAVIIGGVFSLFIPTLVSAQNVEPGKPADVCGSFGGVELGCLPGIDRYAGAPARDSIVDIVLRISEFLIFIGVAIAVFFIVIGGYWLITSNGDAERAGNGRKALVGAIIGITLAIVSATIIALVSYTVQNLDIFAGDR
jgi:hypothetical protein